MIIQLESTTTDNIDTARHTLKAIAQSWGHEITAAPAEATAAAGIISHDDGKAIDPVAMVTLVLSIPSATLAALDLADRIHKRRRATELIGHAQQFATQQITVTLITQTRAVELQTLTPDQLLDLADEDPARQSGSCGCEGPSTPSGS